MSVQLRAAGAAFVLAIAGPAVAEPTFTPEAFRAHVAFLADDRLEGRKPGERGYDLAALYVAQQMAGMGLKPGGVAGSWYQPVRLIRASFTGPGISITTHGPAGQRTWTSGPDFASGPDPRVPHRKVEAEAVFVGYGLDAPEHGFDDYRGLDVKGKVVVAFFGSPPGTPSEIGAHLASEKMLMAARRGAIGFHYIGTDSFEKIAPWDKMLAPDANQPTLNWARADGTPHLRAPGLTYGGGFLNRPMAEALFAGAPRTLAQVRAQAAKPKTAVKGFPLKTRLTVERHSRSEIFESPNVVGIIPGSDPVLKEEVVVVMAHLDHLGRRADRQGDQIFNGAMDNATGIAAMLETARALKAGPPPKRTVMFLAVTAEEDGLLGADYFAHNPLAPLEKVAAVVNMDMPVLTYDFTDVVGFGAESSTLGQIAARAVAQAGLKLSPDPAPEQGFFTRSDHYALVKKGVPALYLDTGLGAPGAKAAADEFLSKHYHEPSDDLSLPIRWDAGAKFARINHAVVRELADAPERPRWYEDDFFGRTFAPQAPKARRPRTQAD